GSKCLAIRSRTTKILDSGMDDFCTADLMMYPQSNQIYKKGIYYSHSAGFRNSPHNSQQKTVIIRQNSGSDYWVVSIILDAFEKITAHGVKCKIRSKHLALDLSVQHFPGKASFREDQFHGVRCGGDRRGGPRASGYGAIKAASGRVQSERACLRGFRAGPRSDSRRRGPPEEQPLLYRDVTGYLWGTGGALFCRSYVRCRRKGAHGKSAATETGVGPCCDESPAGLSSGRDPGTGHRVGTA